MLLTAVKRRGAPIAGWLTDHPVVLVGGAVAVALSPLAGENLRKGLASFFVERPLEAGVVSGVLLTLLVSVIVGTVVDALRETKWESLAAAAFEALAHEVTLVIDSLNWLVTGHPSVGGATPPVAQSDLVHAELQRARLAPVPDDRVHSLRHRVYVRRLTALVASERPSAHEAPWAELVHQVLAARRVDFRNASAAGPARSSRRRSWRASSTVWRA